MNQKYSGYEIEEDTNLYHLQGRVSDMTKEGWEPLPGGFQATERDGGLSYVQVLVLPNHETSKIEWTPANKKPKCQRKELVVKIKDSGQANGYHLDIAYATWEGSQDDVSWWLRRGGEYTDEVIEYFDPEIKNESKKMD